MFRCPDCGQAHKIVVEFQDGEQGLLELSKDAKDMKLIIHGQEITEDHEFRDAYEQKIDSINQEQEIICPECKFGDTLANFIEAHEDPLKYFEVEHLCHCGGELCMDNIPGTNKFGWVCEEEDCRWVKPNAVVSGAAE